MPRLNLSLIPEPGPRRVYLLAAFINTFGTGLVLTTLTLLAVRVVHLTAARTGLAMTIAGTVGLFAAMPIGRLADRHGPRNVYRIVVVVQAAAAVGYVLFAHSFGSFLIVTTVDGAALISSGASNVSLLRRVGGDDATTFRSQMSAVLNLGLTLGVGTAAIAIELNTVNAYRALFLGNALSCLINAAILSRLPKYPPLPGAREESPLAVLKDKAFVGYTFLSGAMYMQYFVLIVLLPVWVVYHTSAPRWTVSAFVIVNTVIVVLFQVRVGKTVQTIRQGGIALRRAGVIFLVSCSAMGLATGIPSWAALLLLATAVTVHSYGELWHASGTFALDFGLAPPHAQGQYQGLVSMGSGAGQALAPIVLIGLVLSLGRLGFVLLGAWFALLGLTGPAIASWGERTRPAAAGQPAADPATADPATADPATADRARLPAGAEAGQAAVVD
jgi:MFS family permease